MDLGILKPTNNARPTLLSITIAMAIMASGSGHSPAHAEPATGELGARFGQAHAAVAICPGMILAPAAGKLRAAQPASDLQNFDLEAEKIRKAWSDAFDCIDLDPETHRFTSCRRTKIASCNAAWSEIGPEGTALPGLIDFKPEEKPND